LIQPNILFKALSIHGIDFFSGVPDSLLKNFCAYITDNASPSKHFITANEGNAVALSSGHYLGTGRPGLVYLQNSGLGNIINPLLSLNDPKVYGIPVLLMIGWRGEPGIKDEPQHLKQGSITTKLLDVMNIPWHIIDSNTHDIENTIKVITQQMNELKSPVAMIVRKNTFSDYSLKNKNYNNYSLMREQVIKQLIEMMNVDDRIVATTGMAARELYELREMQGNNIGNDFLTVGSMGHASSISLGLAISQPNRRVVCFDGDGSVIMHMGSLTNIGQSLQKNLIHIVLNNGAHDSVGGQPTNAFGINLIGIAKSCGYVHVKIAETFEEIQTAFRELLSSSGPSFFEIRIKSGSRKNLGRPKASPSENLSTFMSNIDFND
jgi:phosphonopyruvate decarboxylase